MDALTAGLKRRLEWFQAIIVRAPLEYFEKLSHVEVTLDTLREERLNVQPRLQSVFAVLEGENCLPSINARLLIVVLYQVQKHLEKLSLVHLWKVSNLLRTHPRYDLMEAGCDLGSDVRRAVLTVWLQKLDGLPVNGVVNYR